MGRMLAETTRNVIETLDVGKTHPARSSGFPRMAAAGRTLWIVWRELDEHSAALRLAQVDFPDGS